jgi:hypothetical protein
MCKRRVRFCNFCDAGLTYGREQRCKQCRADRHRERNRIVQRDRLRRPHGYGARYRERACTDCGAPRGVCGAPGRCVACARSRDQKRAASRVYTAAQRQRRIAGMKAYAVYPDDAAKRRALLEDLSHGAT